MKYYILDTCALLSYFSEQVGADISVSKESLSIIDSGFNKIDDVRLIIPNVVFIEVFDKWVRSEESMLKIKAEIFDRINSAENIEIRVLDKETLGNFSIFQYLINRDYGFDNHDKQVFAAAVTMGYTLITSDRNVIDYTKYLSSHPDIVEAYSLPLILN
jgi:hypothetical protein